MATLATVLAPVAVQASSHREAPFISKNPKVDGTDYYAFMSYEAGRAGYVTLLANYIPLEDAAGGPNFFTMDPEAIYEIHIDNNGDGVEDLTFQFKFSSTLLTDATTGMATGFALDIGATGATKHITLPFAYAGVNGPINAANTAGLENVTETYTVNLITGPRRTGTVTAIKDLQNNTTFGKPVDNVGPKTVGEPDYATYANKFITNFDLPGCTPTGVGASTHSRVFVGQRQEGFAVALGPVFDTVNFSEGPGGAGIPNVIGAQDQGLNDVGNKDVTTIAIEVPASCLVAGQSKVFGSWTTASVRQARVINPTATFATPAREGGPFVQVSRLATPLINEVVIGLDDKDRWNSSEPKDDAQWEDYTTNPSLPAVLEIIFGGAAVPVVAPDFFPRVDLDQAFNTGVALPDTTGTVFNVNQIIPNPTVKAEMLRLNTAFGATPRASQNSALGALGCFNAPSANHGEVAVINATNADCDPNGFPNGRRPGDDVVDIEIRAAMGALINTTDAPTGGCLHATQTGCIPYVDGAANNATNLLAVFPYLNPPLGPK